MRDLDELLGAAAGEPPVPLDVTDVFDRARRRTRRRRAAAGGAVAVVAIAAIAGGLALVAPSNGRASVVPAVSPPVPQFAPSPTAGSITKSPATTPASVETRPTTPATAATRRPTPNPATRRPTPNQLTLYPGCPSGAIRASTEVQGVGVKVVSRGPSGLQDDDLCVTLPDGSTEHPIHAPGTIGGYGVYLQPFASGGYFFQDSLGHLFVQIYPGNVSGVTVIVPDGNLTRVLGPFAGGAIAPGSGPAVIVKTTDNCIPDCADGKETTTSLHWDATTGDYR